MEGELRSIFFFRDLLGDFDFFGDDDDAAGTLDVTLTCILDERLWGSETGGRLVLSWFGLIWLGGCCTGVGL